jgi:hypothetical protein
MTKEEIEQMLPADSAERERVIKSMEHSFSLYDFEGNHTPHAHEKENLLGVIDGREKYIVDNNSRWKNECKAHLDKAFILTSALSREDENTKSLVLDPERNALGNIFAVGVYLNIARVHVDRIDAPFAYWFDMEKLEDGMDKSGEAFARQKAQRRINNENDKTAIRNHIGVELLLANGLATTPLEVDFMQTGRASDLPNPDSIGQVISRFQSNIDRRLPKCKHNLKETKNAIERCYAKLLLTDRKTRHAFDKPDYDNVFGDMYIVSMAMLLGARILTEDAGLKKMASFAGIQCFKSVPNRSS